MLFTDGKIADFFYIPYLALGLQVTYPKVLEIYDGPFPPLDLYSQQDKWKHKSYELKALGEGFQD